MNHFVFLNFYFGAKNGSRALSMANSLAFRRVSPGGIIIVLFWTEYAVPRQFKPGILKLSTSRGQRNLCSVPIFVSCEEKGCYRIVSLGHQNFDCRSYCGLSRRTQGCRENVKWPNSTLSGERERQRLCVKFIMCLRFSFLNVLSVINKLNDLRVLRDS